MGMDGRCIRNPPSPRRRCRRRRRHRRPSAPPSDSICILPTLTIGPPWAEIPFRRRSSPIYPGVLRRVYCPLRRHSSPKCPTCPDVPRRAPTCPDVLRRVHCVGCKESYENVGTQSALIAGFTVAVLVTLDTSDSKADAFWTVGSARSIHSIGSAPSAPPAPSAPASITTRTTHHARCTAHHAPCSMLHAPRTEHHAPPPATSDSNLENQLQPPTRTPHSAPTSNTNTPLKRQTLFYICSFVALLMLLYTLIIVTVVTVLGPGLALRGKDPIAMEKAVVFIKKERGMIYASFFLGRSRCPPPSPPSPPSLPSQTTTP